MPERNAIDTPLVTVITVTYNSGAYVRDAIESILYQDYKNIELIILDDCSQDDTWQVISEYRDPRIRAFRNESNIGEYPNRNKAISLANGKYLIFIDGDDMVLSHGIGFFVGQMERYPDAGFAVQVTYLNNVILPILLPPVEVLKNYFFGEMNLLSSSFTSNFFKTSIIKSHKLLTNLRSGDEEIRFRLAMQHPTLFVAGWVTWPRETPGSASTRISDTERLKELHSLFAIAPFPESIGKELLLDVENTIKRKVARLILRLLLTFRFNEARSFFGEMKFSIKELWKYLDYKPHHSDILNYYTPVNPYRQGKTLLL